MGRMEPAPSQLQHQGISLQNHRQVRALDVQIIPDLQVICLFRKCLSEPVSGIVLGGCENRNVEEEGCRCKDG